MITKIEQKNENVLINATKQETKEVDFEIKNKEKGTSKPQNKRQS